MTSRCTEDFWDQFNSLPLDVRERARRAYLRWRNDPSARGLWFKPVQGKVDWWEVRVTRSYRALCLRDGEDCVWFFIGSHAEFDSLT